MKKEYIIGGVVLAAVVGGYFWWKSKQGKKNTVGSVIDAINKLRMDSISGQATITNVDSFYTDNTANGKLDYLSSLSPNDVDVLVDYFINGAKEKNKKDVYNIAYNLGLVPSGQEITEW